MLHGDEKDGKSELRDRWKLRLVRHFRIISLVVVLAGELFATAGWAQEQSDGDPQPAEVSGPFDSVESAYPADEIQRLPPIESPETSVPNLEPGSDAESGKEFGTDQRPQGFGMGQGPGGLAPIRYKALWFPSVSLEGQQGNWGLVGQDFSFMCPLWAGSPGMVMLTGGVNNRLIKTDALLPDSLKAYPDNLWDVRLGLMYMRQLSAGQMVTCGVNIGSASDRPFGSLQEMNVSFMAMYRRPSGERNAWMFGLMYSPTSEIQFPIPMISYNWNPSDQFQANLGIPFSICYRPDDRWTFEASYMPIHTINAKCSYRLTDRLKVVGAYGWLNENYMLYDRTDSNDRFFLYDQHITIGLESSLASWVTLELTGGYAFDRYSYIGQQWDSTQYDRVNIANGPFMMFSASLRR